MKTKILITALMIAFSTCVIAETNKVKSEDSLFTSSLANINEINSSETGGMNVIFSNSSEYELLLVSYENAVSLEEWVESRESWEQESSELPAGINLTESADLESWIESRELWEQENSEMITLGNSVETVNLEEWISSRETWEQENYGFELTNESTGTMQEEWISNMEAWEQK